NEVLRPEGRAEDVELAFGKIPPDRLAAFPGQPAGAEIQQKQQRTAAQSQVAIQALEGSGVDFFAAGIQVDGLDDLGRGDILNWNLLAHQCCTTALGGCPGDACRPGSEYLLHMLRLTG